MTPAIAPGVPARCSGVVDSGELVLRLTAEGVTSRIRLAGVWAPHLIDAKGPIKLSAEESAHDLDARAGDRDVFVEFQPQIDGKQDWALVYLASDGSLVNETIIRDGFAFTEPSHEISGPVAERLRVAQDDAIRSLAGLWGPIDAVRQTLDKPRPEPRADGWLSIAANLEVGNPKASNEWYGRIIKEYPTSIAAVESRKKLGIDPVQLSLPDLTRDTGVSLLEKLNPGLAINRPIILPEIRLPGPSRRTEPKEEAVGDVPDPVRSISPRRSPGTEVQVRGYTRKNGTYVAPHTRSAPRRR